MDILKPAKKRHTKAEKATDDQLLKDIRAAQENAIAEGIGCLVTLEMKAKSKDAEAQVKKPQPVPPHVPPHVVCKAAGASTGPVNPSSSLSDVVTLTNLTDSTLMPPSDGPGSIANGNIKKQPVSLKESLWAMKALCQVEGQQNQCEWINHLWTYIDGLNSCQL